MGYCSTFSQEVVKSDKDIAPRDQKKATYSVYGWKKGEGYEPGETDSSLWSIVDGGILPPEESTKYCDYYEDLLEIVETLTKLGYKIEGEVTRYGEENEDIEKLVIKDGKVESKMATIVFE